MSKLVKLKLASKKSLSCFLPIRMATPGTSTLFPSSEPDAAPNDRVKPNGVKTERKVREPSKHEATAGAPRPPENLERAMVAVESKEPTSKTKEVPKSVEEEEVLEIKTPGFIRMFGTCDNCEESEHDDDRHKAHSTSSDESMDESSSRSSAHQPPHLIPVVHLRVPMKNKDDVRKVVAALQLRGVLEVACDLENQIVKVTGNADPDRLLKKVKKVKRKSKLISYTDPVEMPVPPASFHSDIPTPPPPPPPYAFHQPAYEDRFRPPPQSHAFTRESCSPYGPPPGHVRPNLRHTARPMHYDNEAFYRHHNPPPNVRPPPPGPAFYRDESFYPDYTPSNLRRPSSPPHYSSTSFYPERSPPNLRHSSSPPRRRSYYHEWSSPSFRRPPPPMHYPGGPPSYHRSSPWGPGASYDFQRVPDRMMDMYH